MQRLHPSGIAAVLSIIALSVAPGCKADKADKDPQADSAPGKQVEDADAIKPAAKAGAAGETGPGAAVATGAAGATGAAALGTEAGTEVPAGTEAGTEAEVEDPVPALLEQAKNLETEHKAALQALDDAIAADGSKIAAAKVANARGEALMAKGESEQAEALFQWAAKTHKLYAEPVYNLATVAAYAGDLDIAKDHLQELKKRGNKKLMKKVGVDPAFAPLHDDPDVRKIYEQP